MNIEQVTGDRLRIPSRVETRTQEKGPCVERPFVRTAAVWRLMSLFFLLSSSLLLAQDKDLQKHFGLIYGTAYGPDDRPVYGAKIEIHPVGQKHPHWELMSDHQGEFALRVPPGPADYLVSGEAMIVPMENGVPQSKKKKKIKAERTIHIQAEERQDIGLHLAE